MDAKTFLGNFATIADAPNGVQRLRDLALKLAVSGHLVEQPDGDDQACVALETVRAEKGATLADSIRGGGSVPRIPGLEERGNELPPGWEWARLDDTGEYINGLAFKNSDWKSSGIPIIRIQNLTKPSVPFNYADGPFPEDRMAHDGDILVSWSATLNAFRWNRGDAVVNQHIFKVSPDHRVVIADYLFPLLRHCIRAMAESEAAHGLVMKHINRGPFLSHVVALPPLAEQERIVAKLNELTELCDGLEALQEHRHRATTRFRGSALHALTEAETPDDLSHAWKRVNANWSALANHSDGVGQLRTIALRLAVMGRLGTQRAADKPASYSLGRAANELADQPKTKGRDASVQRREGDAAVSIGPPVCRTLPPGWATAPLSAAARLESGHTPDRNIAGYWDGPIPWIGIRDARANRDGIILNTEKSITQAGIDNSSTRLLPAETVCLSRTASVGYCVIMGIPMCTSQDFVNFVCTTALLPRYLQILFMAELNALKRFARGAVHLTIYFPEVKAFHLLLPPLAEQARIVARVDELMALCDHLESGLRTQRQVQSLFAGNIAAVFASAAPTIA